MMRNNRMIMKEGTEILFPDRKLIVGELKSDGGSSCLVYRGIVEKENGSREQVIVKEFYPRGSEGGPWFIRCSDQHLKLIDERFRDNPEYDARRKQFRQGMDMQQKIAFSDAMEVIVRPSDEFEYGDSIYNINQLHMGGELDLERFSTFGEKLDLTLKIVNMMSILEKNQYLLLDYKPQNLLWIEDTKQVKLLDLDSVIDMRTLKDLCLEDINCDPSDENPYMRQVVKDMLMSESAFEEDKERLLSLSRMGYRIDVYSIGITLFYLLFGRYPNPHRVRLNEFDEDVLIKELLKKYPGYRKSVKSVIQLLKTIFSGNGIIGGANYRYSLDMISEDVDNILHYIEVEEEQRKKNQKANFVSVCYHMIQKYPVFRYSRYLDGVYQMEIAVFGAHAVRTMLLQTIIPSCQMLNGNLKIRLFSEDAVNFWNKFRKKNPALERAVLYYIDDELQNETDDMVVDRPLAEIYLYNTERPSDVRKKVMEHHIGYILLVTEDYKKNQQICLEMQGVLSGAEGNHYLVGYIGEQKYAEDLEHITYARISTSKLTEEYDEKIFQNDVYKMGLAVHTFYEAGEQTAADEKMIEKKYREAYNFESSQRSAINIIYKLQSLGINYQAEDVQERFVKFIFGEDEESGERLQQLIYLEHMSWIAEKLTHGVIPADFGEVSRKAFRAGNDWKIKDEDGRLRHPCISASRIGSHLKESDWENDGYLESDRLDPLEKMSIHCRKVSGKEAERRRNQIRIFIEEILKNNLRDYMEVHLQTENSAGIWACFEGYKEAVEDLYDSEDGNAGKYNIMRKAFEDSLKNAGIFDKEMKDSLYWLDSRLQAAIYHKKKRNFKTADKDMIFAVPDILSRWNVLLSD